MEFISLAQFRDIAYLVSPPLGAWLTVKTTMKLETKKVRMNNVNSTRIDLYSDIVEMMTLLHDSMQSTYDNLKPKNVNFQKEIKELNEKIDRINSSKLEARTKVLGSRKVNELIENWRILKSTIEPGIGLLQMAGPGNQMRLLDAIRNSIQVNLDKSAELIADITVQIRKDLDSIK